MLTVALGSMGATAVSSLAGAAKSAGIVMWE
jgi:hypothetical protein